MWLALFWAYCAAERHGSGSVWMEAVYLTVDRKQNCIITERRPKDTHLLSDPTRPHLPFTIIL